jgi:hypothetical protein
MSPFRLLPGLIALSVCSALPATAQRPPTVAAHRDTAFASCPNGPKAVAPPAGQQRAARELAERAQEAAIVGDNATVRDLYRRAASLDPTDATTAYALGRAYEAAGDARAIAEYCRFLALAPTAPEAADVRQRVTSLSLAQTTRVAATRAGIKPRSSPSPGTAFALGIVFPGMGQYYSRRPVPGLLITAATAGALYYGLRSKTVAHTVTRTATDPNGQPYQYQDVTLTNDRPNLAIGVGAAAGVALLGAIEAYAHARSMRSSTARAVAEHDVSPRHVTPSPVISTYGNAVGIGVQLAFR